MVLGIAMIVRLIGARCVWIPFTCQDTPPSGLLKTAAYPTYACEKIDEVEIVSEALRRRLWQQFKKMEVFCVAKLGSALPADPSVDGFSTPRTGRNFVEVRSDKLLIIDLKCFFEETEFLALLGHRSLEKFMGKTCDGLSLSLPSDVQKFLLYV
jgi:hypothetical protein